MDVTPLIPADRQIIHSYGDGGFRISGLRREGSVLIFPGHSLDWPVTEALAITIETLAAVPEDEPKVELLLIGTGKRMLPIPAPVRRHFRALGIMLDSMDTAAACRTYNVLLAEERRIAAALIAV
jgi:uncharacterized protein